MSNNNNTPCGCRCNNTNDTRVTVNNTYTGKAPFSVEKTAEGMLISDAVGVPLCLLPAPLIELPKSDSSGTRTRELPSDWDAHVSPSVAQKADGDSRQRAVEIAMSNENFKTFVSFSALGDHGRHWLAFTDIMAAEFNSVKELVRARLCAGEDNGNARRPDCHLCAGLVRFAEAEGKDAWALRSLNDLVLEHLRLHVVDGADEVAVPEADGPCHCFSPLRSGLCADTQSSPASTVAESGCACAGAASGAGGSSAAPAPSTSTEGGAL